MWLVPFVESTESSKVPARSCVSPASEFDGNFWNGNKNDAEFTVMLRHTWLQHSRKDQRSWREANLAARQTPINQKEEDEDITPKAVEICCVPWLPKDSYSRIWKIVYSC